MNIQPSSEYKAKLGIMSPVGGLFNLNLDLNERHESLPLYECILLEVLSLAVMR